MPSPKDYTTVNDLSFIREYYKPIQPAVSKSDGKISYSEKEPDKALENIVYCYWQLHTPFILKEDFNYRVVSDGCIDIFFNHKKPTDCWIMGFCKRFEQFPIGKEFDYIGIRFLPSTFTLLFGIAAKSLTNQSLELREVLPDFSEWIATKIKPSDSFKKIVRLLNQKLLESLKNQEIQHDPRFLNSLKLIFLKKGNLDTEKDINTGLSPRQLRRVFNFYLGTTAKSFSNVMRFQHILNAKPSRQSLKENKLYYDVGFYDQAHFIKSFKTFYGVTPQQAFG